MNHTPPSQPPDSMDSDSSGSTGPLEAQLQVRDVMSTRIVTVSAGENAKSAIRKMSENNVSCIIVTTGNRVDGILTERDLMREVGAGRKGLHATPVARIMSSPVVAVPPELPIMGAGEILERQDIRRLVVKENHQLLGIVTQTDIMRGLIFMSGLQDVSDIMSAEVATLGPEETVAEAARLMASRNISCVVVMRQDRAVGILTERDLLKRVLVVRKDPSATAAIEVMSYPLETVAMSSSVFSASRIMDELHIRRLVVVDGTRVCGIVTQTDIMTALRKELHRQMETQHCSRP